jgi:predicted DNA-binding protein (UPF0251 family)
MPRKKCLRHVDFDTKSSYFKPRGIPMNYLQEVCLEADEFEAIRLRDLEGLYQEKAAEQMGISRQTFGRILESAHKKMADALINGKAIKINNDNNYTLNKFIHHENSSSN